MKVLVESKGLEADLQGVADLLVGPGRIKLHQAMGTELQIGTENHLRDLAANRHTTAERLGAAPTGFLALAADQVSSPAALSAELDAATLTIRFPGVTRAFGAITIKPINSTFLAIPLNALAYGRRPAEMRLTGEKVALIIKDGHRTGKEKPRTAKSEEEKNARQDIAAFVLVRSVTQQQDRSLLPSDQQWEGWAKTGAENEIVDVMRRKMGL